ncbi:hypothetical protein [uncultured Nostoc sp.]
MTKSTPTQPQFRDKGDKGNNPCPMPNAQCPMPNAQCPMPCVPVDLIFTL